ncbi:hypothetical protein PPUN109347_35220 [Pseudomonas putida]|nr:hypothetical protein PPUN109347_35220 [Pseudomonas putida]
MGDAGVDFEITGEFGDFQQCMQARPVLVVTVVAKHFGKHGALPSGVYREVCGICRILQADREDGAAERPPNLTGR